MLARASLRHFRHHPWQLLLLLLGIMLGVAVVTAVDITSDSARRSFREAQLQIYGQATHRIVANTPLAESLYAELRRNPRDWKSAPVISGLVKDDLDKQLLMQLIGVDPLRESGFRNQLNRIQTAGVGFSSLQATASAVLARSTADELGVNIGDALPLQTAAGLRTVQVIGLLEDQGDVRLQKLLLMDIGQAQQLLAMAGQISHIDLILDGVEQAAVREVLPPGVRLESTEAALAERSQLASALYFNLQALSLLALVVGLFLVYSSVWFSLSQRRPIFAQLRAVGLDKVYLYRYLAAELLGIALVATVLGIGLGIALAHLLLGLLVQVLDDLYASSSLTLLVFEPWVISKLLLLGVGGSLVAAWQPCREIAQVSPLLLQQRYVQEQRSQRSARFYLLITSVLFAISLLLMLWRGSGLWGAFVAVAALLLGFALLMPALLRALVEGVSQVLARWGWLGRKPLLAMILRDSARNLSRTGIAAMALMIAISATVGIGGMVGSFRDAVQLWLGERLNADLYISQPRNLPGVRPALPEALISDLEKMEAVAAVATLSRTQLSVGQRPVYLYASELPVAMRDAYRFVSGDPERIWPQVLEQGGVLISEPLANRSELTAGDSITLNTHRGPAEFIVAGVYYDYGSDSGRLLTAAATLAQHWPTESAYGVALFLNYPENADAVEQAIRSRWGEQVDLSIQQSSSLLALSLEVFNRTFVITDVLRLLALLVAFIGILSSLLAIQLERQQEVSLLKALGFSQRELMTLLLGQALLLGMVAGLVAIIAGELLAWSLTAVVQLRAFGWTIPYGPQPEGWLTALALSLIAATLASLYPAWRFARQRGIRRWE